MLTGGLGKASEAANASVVATLAPARPQSRGWRTALIAVFLCAEAAAASEGLLWFENGRPGAVARQAVGLLDAAPGHGLDPKDYEVVEVRRALSRAAEGLPVDAASLPSLDRDLTAAMERFFAHLHGGRVDPRLIHHGFKPTEARAFDPGKHLRDALASGRLADAVREAAPQLPQYDRLRTELARYRELVGNEAWQQPLQPPAGDRKGRVLRPGAPYDDLARLTRRLVALGDLPADSVPPPSYEGAVVEAIRLFQHRHGLPADGAMGPGTLAQLQVTPTARVRQIELMLERLRWTPLLRGSRMVVINVPEFVLRAYEVRDGRIQVQREMKVIVGKALRTRTPVFDEDMRFIEFSPFWNVPPSIARGEIVPRLRRDPGYFHRQGFEFVGPDGGADATLTGAKLDALVAGKLRIRQAPGPSNALGDIKFVFPNSQNIYLHHTPATQLFAQARRDFSHGCIRVEDPVALATFVLAGETGWNEERIRQAMAAGQSSTLRLAKPVPVLIAYGTALVKQNRIHFFEDIYGLDRLLDAALRGGRTQR